MAAQFAQYLYVKLAKDTINREVEEKLARSLTCETTEAEQTTLCFFVHILAAKYIIFSSPLMYNPCYVIKGLEKEPTKKHGCRLICGTNKRVGYADGEGVKIHNKQSKVKSWV